MSGRGMSIPEFIRRPPPNSALQRTCDDIAKTLSGERSTLRVSRETVKWALDCARNPVAPPTDHDLLARELMKLRLVDAVFRSVTDNQRRREAVRLLLIVRYYLSAGGNRDRRRACEATAVAYGPGISAEEVDEAVERFFAAVGRLSTHDEHMADTPTFSAQVVAALAAADDLWLSHARWTLAAVAAADDAADSEARYQPVFGDPE